jgi:hypothetical protein
MTTRSLALTVSLFALTACKSIQIGPFADEPREQPTAPEPDWGGAGVGKSLDAGVSDAEAPVQRSK